VTGTAARFGARSGEAAGDDGVERRVDAFEQVDVCLDDLARRAVARADRGGELRGGAVS
jgi:hypothetical protein